MIRRRRAIILPVVLFIMLLLGLLIGTYAFKVNADIATVRAARNQMQSRLAAEAGIEKLKLMLRFGRLDRELWWNNPDELNRIIVWSDEGDESVYGTNDEFRKDTTTWRYSIVADDPTDDENFCRFGVTDEQSKVNLNIATPPQLLSLVTAAVGDNDEISPQEIVDAILDWRDPDSQPRGESGDTEGAYYKELPKPYAPRNAPFESVEELLLVKGITPDILYGEDIDRNGLLTENEDDADESYPMDNGDGRLNRGLYPYLTILSYDNNVSNDNRQRINLKSDQAAAREALLKDIPDEQAVDYLLQTAKGQTNNQDPSKNKKDDKPGSLPPPKGPIQPQPPKPTRPIPDKNKLVKQDRQPSLSESRKNESKKPPTGPPQTAGQPEEGTGGTTTGGQPTGGQTTGGQPNADGSTGQPTTGGQPNAGGQGGTGGNPLQPGSGSTQPKTVVDLFVPKVVNGVEQPSPLKLEFLPIVMDRTTLDSPDKKLVGLINVNSAPAEVLRTLDGLTEEQVKTIVGTRDGLTSEELSTPAWLVTKGVLDLPTLQKIAPIITARGTQFTIESIGYADHIGTVTRLQVVVDMLGPIPQTLYYRDVSNLGGSFPIREEDKEKQRVR